LKKHPYALVLLAARSVHGQQVSLLSYLDDHQGCRVAGVAYGGSLAKKPTSTPKVSNPGFSFNICKRVTFTLGASECQQGIQFSLIASRLDKRKQPLKAT
jgi:hypothetical protein